MNSSLETSPTKYKKPMRPCPKCPHRLSDLRNHEDPAEAAQSTTKTPKEETFTKNEDQIDNDSSSTAVENDFHNGDTSRTRPDYPDIASEGSNPPEYSSHEDVSKKEYHELQSDDGLESTDEYETVENYKSATENHSDEEDLLDKHLPGAEAKDNEACLCTDDGDEKPAWFKCTICEPWVPLKLDAESRKNVNIVPEFYICHCDAMHGNPSESEKIEATFANEELSESWETNKQYMLNKMFNQPTLFKRCDKCKAGLEARFRLFIEPPDKPATEYLVKPRAPAHLLIKDEGFPSWYTCFCGKNHGSPGRASTEVLASGEQDGESSNPVKDDKLCTRLVTDDGVIQRTVENGHLTLWKLCDKCEEIKQLELASDFKNPRLFQLHTEVKVYEESESERQDGDQFQEWKQFAEDVLRATTHESAKVHEVLSTVVEEDEE